MSKHWLRKYPNLFKTQTIERSEQVWVSDITYIKTEEGNCYLNMVTDAYSRKIMGYAIADTMDTEAMIKAFEMGLKNRKYPDQPLIHHSDRGLQYCSKEYIALSKNTARPDEPGQSKVPILPPLGSVLLIGSLPIPV